MLDSQKQKSFKLPTTCLVCTLTVILCGLSETPSSLHNYVSALPILWSLQAGTLLAKEIKGGFV